MRSASFTKYLPLLLLPCIFWLGFKGIPNYHNINKPAAAFNLITEKQFNALFPQRNKFYTYASFIQAIKDMANLQVKVTRRSTYIYQYIRTDKKTGKKEEACRYYISSRKAMAPFFHHAIRAHWSIENKLHWMLDVVFGEDDSKKQARNAAQNFSLLNKIALNMVRSHEPGASSGSKVISAKRKRKMAAWDNDYLAGIFLSFAKVPI